jgi:hypothetical protein
LRFRAGVVKKRSEQVPATSWSVPSTTSEAPSSRTSCGAIIAKLLSLHIHCYCQTRIDELRPYAASRLPVFDKSSIQKLRVSASPGCRSHPNTTDTPNPSTRLLNHCHILCTHLLLLPVLIRHLPHFLFLLVTVFRLRFIWIEITITQSPGKDIAKAQKAAGQGAQA